MCGNIESCFLIYFILVYIMILEGNIFFIFSWEVCNFYYVRIIYKVILGFLNIIEVNSRVYVYLKFYCLKYKMLNVDVSLYIC